MPHRVCQVFSSAVPCAYAKSTRSTDWQPFAQRILEGTFEATLAVAALLSRQRGGERVPVFLTQVGGGAFGNRSAWIVAAISRALRIHRYEPLDVRLVHYRTTSFGEFGKIERALAKAGKKKK